MLQQRESPCKRTAISCPQGGWVHASFGHWPSRPFNTVVINEAEGRVRGSRSKNQRNLGTRPNRDCHSSSEGIGSDAFPLRIFSHCDHTDGALAEWGPVFERSRDAIHFPNRGARVGYLLNQNEVLLIGDVLDLKMVNAIRGSRGRARWFWTKVISPGRGYIRSEDFGMENSPRKQDCDSSDEHGSRRSRPDGHVHAIHQPTRILLP